MTDIRYPISGNIRIWFVPFGGLARPGAPTEAEIAAGLDISDAVSWNDKDFGVQASNTTEDPAITAKGKTTSRGAAQYGGALSMYYPLDRTDASSDYKKAEDAIGVPGIRGYIIKRVDGVELLSDEGTAAQPGVLAEAGDLVEVFDVETAGFGQAITGEEAFRYTVSFLPKGFVKTNAIVRASATPAIPVIVGTGGSGAVGSIVVLTGTLVGRRYTRGLRWASTDSTIVSVSRNGVAKRVAAGTASVTATDPATGAVSTATAFTVA
jgi:hypothetical protein